MNPFLDVTQGSISYERVIGGLYSCYNVDFKNKFVNEYNVFFKNDSRGIEFSSFQKNMKTTSRIILNDDYKLAPNLNNLKSIREFDLDINKLKYKQKILGKPRRIEECSPLIFYFFACMLDPFPDNCLEFDYKAVFD